MVVNNKINRALSDKDKQFIISVKESQPEWGLIEVLGDEKLPSVEWKLMYSKRMD